MEFKILKEDGVRRFAPSGIEIHFLKSENGYQPIFQLVKIQHNSLIIKSAPDWIRTNDRPLRRRVLYPSELQALTLRFVAARWSEVKIRVAIPQNCFLPQLRVPNFMDFA